MEGRGGGQPVSRSVRIHRVHVELGGGRWNPGKGEPTNLLSASQIKLLLLKRGWLVCRLKVKCTSS